MVDKVHFSWVGPASTKKEKVFIGVALFSWVVLLILAWWAGHVKIVEISALAFMAMAVAIPWGMVSARGQSAHYPATAYGFCSGAMMTSAAIFLIPEAIGYHTLYGSVGIVAGMAMGFAIHHINKRASEPFELTKPVVIELTIHALAAGFVMGLVYRSMPDLSLLLGLAIISHKAPAGYAVARRLVVSKQSPWVLFIPASGIGLTALPVSLLRIPFNPIVNALIFGLATGLFFHIALEFLPLGRKSHGQTIFSSNSSNYVRAILSTVAGAALVLALWFLTS